MELYNQISELVQKGKGKDVRILVQQAVDGGASALEILEKGLLPGLSAVGEQYKDSEIFVPEVLVAARAYRQGEQLLRPLLAGMPRKTIGRVCIGTVRGDLHDIGKDLVKTMMEGRGLEVIDLGTDVPAETFIKTAIEQNCRIICCSALLLTTMNEMNLVVRAAEEAGIRNRVQIMIGGAPVTEGFCRQIGADAYTPDAGKAAEAAVNCF